MGLLVKILSTELTGVVVVETAPFVDQRGAFSRWFGEDSLSDVMQWRRIRQINHSKTSQAGAVRGFHFQHPPHAEMKLIRCTRGRVFDVAVDFRQGSPTFLRWHAEELTASNARMLVIPEGCAHGFQALDGDTELLYLHTAMYAPQAEGGARYDDARIGIRWPLPVVDLSQRDRSFAALGDGFAGIPSS